MVPSFQDLMLPLLRLAAESANTLSILMAIDVVAEQFLDEITQCLEEKSHAEQIFKVCWQLL